MKNLVVLLSLIFGALSPMFANVLVSAPSNGATLNSGYQISATGTTTTCSKGVASMGVYIDSSLAYVVNGTSLNTTLQVATGAHKAVLQEWDYCGGATSTPVPITVTNQDGVWVVYPKTNSTVGSLTNVVATATTSCASGVASMGVYVNQQMVAAANGASLNTQITLAPGAQQAIVQEWDNCGGSYSTPVSVTVTGSTFYSLQMNGGWKSSGQLPPYYSDCNSSCVGVTLSMAQGLSNPSLSGQSAQFNLGGTTPYADALFYNQLIGAFSTEGLPDTKHTLVPSVHNFIYDAYFYAPDPAHTQALEFDVNWFMNAVGMTWGTECRLAGGNEWDVWDNANAKWVSTGIPCYPIANAWNHVTVNAQRAANNTLLYQSITLNGTTYNLNRTYPPFWVPQNWYGITVNYQMDGDSHQTSISSYVDNFTFTYW